MNPDLHILDLRTSIAELDACQKLLSPSETEQMLRFVTQTLRDKFALCRGFLRLTLAKYLLQDPARIEFQYTEFGKPFVTNTLLQFNLAHSGDYCVIACSEQNAIGVDIEHCDPRHHPLEIAKRFFTPREYHALQKAADPIVLFFHIWTQKEAFLKAIGRGLTFGLDQFEVSTNLSEAYVKKIKDPEYAARFWHSRSFDHLPGYQLTLTEEHQLEQLNIFNQ